MSDGNGKGLMHEKDKGVNRKDVVQVREWVDSQPDHFEFCERQIKGTKLNRWWFCFQVSLWKMRERRQFGLCLECFSVVEVINYC